MEGESSNNEKKVDLLLDEFDHTSPYLPAADLTRFIGMTLSEIEEYDAKHSVEKYKCRCEVCSVYDLTIDPSLWLEYSMKISDNNMMVIRRLKQRRDSFCLMRVVHKPVDLQDLIDKDKDIINLDDTLSFLTYSEYTKYYSTNGCSIQYRFSTSELPYYLRKLLRAKIITPEDFLAAHHALSIELWDSMVSNARKNVHCNDDLCDHVEKFHPEFVQVFVVELIQEIINNPPSEDYLDVCVDILTDDEMLLTVYDDTAFDYGYMRALDIVTGHMLTTGVYGSLADLLAHQLLRFKEKQRHTDGQQIYSHLKTIASFVASAKPEIAEATVKDSKSLLDLIKE